MFIYKGNGEDGTAMRKQDRPARGSSMRPGSNKGSYTQTYGITVSSFSTVYWIRTQRPCYVKFATSAHTCIPIFPLEKLCAIFGPVPLNPLSPIFFNHLSRKSYPPRDELRETNSGKELIKLFNNRGTKNRERKIYTCQF